MCFLLVLAFTSIVSAQQEITETGYVWTPTDPGLASFYTDEGYKISATVTQSNLDGEAGQYVVISSNSGNGDDGIRFTYTVEQEYQFVIGYDTFSAELVQGGTVSIRFQRIGEAPETTTEAPITDATFPTPANESRLLTVYIGGNKPTDYFDTTLLTSLKTNIVDMAKDYCSSVGFLLTEEITVKNVLIDKLTTCPSSWHDSETCAQLTFALPIVYDEFHSGKSGYHLQTSYLQIMWDTLAYKYLNAATIYDAPNLNRLNIIWYLAAAAMVASFFIVLLVLRWVVIKVTAQLSATKISFQNENTTAPWDSSQDTKISSTQQHEFQATPDFFDLIEDYEEI